MTTTALAQHLSSFLSRQQVHWLGQNPPRVSRVPEEFSAALLLVDLSGFSKLTGGYSEKGIRGAEELSELLHSYFDPSIDTILDHGGDILFFAGDSILALWPEADEPGAAVALAAECALNLNRQVTGPATAPLQRHAGIAAGKVRAYQLGGVQGRWHTLIAGPALRQLGTAVDEAGPGQVVLSPEALQASAGRCHSRPSPSGSSQLLAVRRPQARPPRSDLRPSPDLGARMTGYVPDIVSQRLQAGQEGWIAEFRSVSIVFANLPNLNLPRQQTAAALQRAVAHIQRELERYEGTLYQFLMDEKGVCMVAAFGLPPRAHEDDPERAVEAAQAIQVGLGWKKSPPSVGVATGTVLCGVLGNHRRRQYSILGTTINLSARLMHAARGGVLIDQATALGAAGRVQVERLEPIRVKGWTEPVSVFRPGEGQVQRDQRYARPLLGRQVESERLEQRLDELLAGRGSLTVAVGEAGIGKSHLLSDWMARARKRGVMILFGAGDTIEQSTQYFAWRSILQQLLEGDRGTLTDRVIEALTGKPRLLNWAPLLKDILPLELEDSPLVQQMESRARATALRDVVLYLFRQSLSRGEPILLVLDDLAWMDSSSILLARSIIRSCPELMAVASTRPPGEPARTDLLAFVDLAGDGRIDLDSLPREAVGDLVAGRLAVSRVPNEILSFIWERAEGHPLHSEELALALREAGAIHIRDQRCILSEAAKDLSKVSIPTSVQGIITSRIDRLSTATQLSLKTASVIGRVFSRRMLKEVHPSRPDRQDLLNHLEELERFDLIRLEKANPEPVYGFRHAIARDVAYQAMLFAQRRPLHLNVARWLEREHTEDRESQYGLLAYHWERTQARARALHYLEKAGSRAMLSYSNREAVDFFRRALKLSQEGIVIRSSRMAEWELRLGIAHLKLSNYRAARRHLHQSLAKNQLKLASSRVALAGELAGGIVKQSWHRVVPGRVASPSPAEQRLRRTEAETALRLSETSLFYGDALEFVNWILRGTNASEQAGDVSHMIVGYGGIAISLGLMGLHRAARWYAARTLELARGTSDVYDRCYGHEVASVYSISVADWTVVDRACTEAEDGFSQIGDRFRWETSRAIHGYSYLLRGRFEDAEQAFSAAHGSAYPEGARQVRVWARAGQICARLPRGLPVEEHVRELRRLTETDLNTTEQVLALGMIAAALSRTGDLDAAVTVADGVLDLLATSSPTVYYLKWPLTAVAEVYLQVWSQAGGLSEVEASRVRRHCGMASRALRRLGRMNPVVRPAADLIGGRIALLEGKRSQAQRLWRQSQRKASQMGMPFDRDLAGLLRSLAAGDPPRPPHSTNLEALGAGAETDWWVKQELHSNA